MQALFLHARIEQQVVLDIVIAITIHIRAAQAVRIACFAVEGALEFQAIPESHPAILVQVAWRVYLQVEHSRVVVRGAIGADPLIFMEEITTLYLT